VIPPWDFSIFIDAALCHAFSGSLSLGETREIYCDKPLRGRKVRIEPTEGGTMQKTADLVLCEVEVYGIPSQGRIRMNNFYFFSMMKKYLSIICQIKKPYYFNYKIYVVNANLLELHFAQIIVNLFI